MEKTQEKPKKKSSFFIGALVSFILFLIYIAALIYFIVSGGGSSGGFTVLGLGRVGDLIFMFVLPLVSQIFFFLFSTLFVRLYIWIAKRMKRGSYKVFVKNLEQTYSLGEFFSRTFYAAMLSVALSISLNNILDSYGIPLFIETGIVYSVAAVAFLCTPISILIMAPAWILNDSGVMFLKNENYDELRNEKVLSKPIDIRSIGSYFIQLVKGFAGITTPLLYIFLFVQNPDVFSGELVLSIMLVVEPFFLVGSFFFSLWIYLKLLPKVRERLLRKLNYPEISIRIES